MQHNTRLYLLNHGALAAELFYQLGLRQFGNFSRFRLDSPPDLRTLVQVAVEDLDQELEALGEVEVYTPVVCIQSVWLSPIARQNSVVYARC